ncbi:MAG: response regulator [Magnetococcales bacterium]|nr:response regulator [Magnetococcales bacterium]
MMHNDNDMMLMVEDDPAAIQIALHAFTKSGVDEQRIVVAKNGQKALDFLFGGAESDNPIPRLILLDLKLPKVNGLDVLKTIREAPTTKDVPVIILTNSDEEIDVVRGYNLGANSYLKKPVDFIQLVEILEQLGLMPK